MDRDLALANSIESLRNEVKSMWNEIQTSFNQIDQEIDETIHRYESPPTTAASSTKPPSPSFRQNNNNNILHEDEEQIGSDDQLIRSMATQNTKNGSAHHKRTESPFQAAMNTNMGISPAVSTRAHSAYNTPVASHTMNRSLSFVSNTDSAVNNVYDTPKIVMNFSQSSQLLSSLNDFNRNEAVSEPLSLGISNESSHRPINITNPKNSPSVTSSSTESDDEEMQQIGFSILNSDDEQSSPIKSQRSNLIKRISTELEQNAHLIFGHQNLNHNRHNTVHNLSDIDTPNNEEENVNFFKDHQSDSSSSSFLSDNSLNQMQQQQQNNEQPLINIDISANNVNDDTSNNGNVYPLGLPSIPQQSSIDHQTPEIDHNDVHQKKKSISELQINDLQLDKKATTFRRKASLSRQESTDTDKQPLTPLAMHGIVFSDIPNNKSSVSIPSPPLLSNEDRVNGVHLTSDYVESNDYMQLFEEEEEESEKQKLTDVNYTNNNVTLHSEINRADSEYVPSITKDIETILNETKLYQMMNEDENPQPMNTAISISPKVKASNILSYSFDEHYHNQKTPVIMSEEDEDGIRANEIFEEIEETLLIVKKDGIRFINDICDRLANDDENDFYINEFKQMQKNKDEYEQIHLFLKQHSAINADIKNVIHLFSELISNECFYIFPLYRVNAISFLYDAIKQYQSLKLMDDELRNRMTLHQKSKNSVVSVSKFEFDGGHFKKPTDELPTMDNEHFRDYEEYATPTADDGGYNNKVSKVEQIQNKKLRDWLRDVFDVRNVACPQNQSEYRMIKEVLWKDTKYCQQNENERNINDENKEFMQSIAIIKPNAVRDGLCDLIRAQLVGNGYIIQNIQFYQFEQTKKYQMENVIDAMDSKNKDYLSRNVRKECIEYLLSGKVAIMQIKKESNNFDELSQLIGDIDPIRDRQNNENTESVRGCFGEDIIHNSIDVTLAQSNYQKMIHLLFE